MGFCVFSYSAFKEILSLKIVFFSEMIRQGLLAVIKNVLEYAVDQLRWT